MNWVAFLARSLPPQFIDGLLDGIQFRGGSDLARMMEQKLPGIDVAVEDLFAGNEFQGQADGVGLIIGELLDPA